MLANITCIVCVCWLSRCNVAGVEVQFKLGGRLVGERTRRPNSFVLSKCLFADDAALVCCAPVERIWCWLSVRLMR